MSALGLLNRLTVRILATAQALYRTATVTATRRTTAMMERTPARLASRASTTTLFGGPDAVPAGYHMPRSGARKGAERQPRSNASHAGHRSQTFHQTGRIAHRQMPELADVWLDRPRIIAGTRSNWVLEVARGSGRSAQRGLGTHHGRSRRTGCAFRVDVE